MEKRKVVIIGAGIGGLSLALYLKKLNINDFVVLNVVNHDVHKACTGLLTEKTVQLLNELDIKLDGYEKVINFKAVYNGTNVKDYSTSGLSLYHFKDSGRETLDNRLYEQCLKKNILIRENCGSLKIDKKHKIVSYSNESIEFEYIVDARGFYTDINKTKHKDIGFECKITHQEIKRDKFGSIILNQNIKGYGWVIYGPKYDVVGMVDEYHKGTNYKLAFDNFIKNQYEGDLSNKEIKSAFIPVKPGKLLINKKHIQIGDKAGLVDPLTQEGIFYAIYSAKLAAEAISLDNFKKYKTSMKKIVSNFKFAYFLRKFFFSRKNQSKLWSITNEHRFADYIFKRYSNDLTPFFYRNISKYHKEYKKEKQA